MATKKPSTSKGLVIQQIVVKPNTRSALDVGQWRNALKAADRGKREKLYDLYEDVLIDLVLSDAIEKRVDAITNAELTFSRNEQPVPEIDDLMDTPEWEEILREIMLTKFWGKTVIEFDFANGLKPYSIPRKHIRADKGVIVKNPSDEDGIPYRGDDFFLEVGNDGDLGLLLKLAPMAIYKRGGFGDWAQFVEIFGMPQRIGKYNSHDNESRKILEEALENAGSASYLVVPKETDIETRDATTYSNALMHEKFKQACNEEMLIGVLGQTMTTLNGSSRSQSETHKQVEEGKNKADRRFVQRVLNRVLLPMLEKRGYPVSGGYFYFAEAGESLTMEQQMNIHDGFINKLGLGIDEDFLYETYSVPKPKGTAKAKPKKEEKPEATNVKDDEKEQKFWERVFSFFLKAPAEMGAQNQNLCPICGGDHHTHFNLSDLPEFDEEALLKRIWRKQPYFDVELYNFISANLIDGLKKGFAQNKLVSQGFGYGFDVDAALQLMELNLFKFSAAKNIAEAQELNQIFAQSKTYIEFKKAASKVVKDFNENWQLTEYNTAYLTGESSGTYYRLKEETDVFHFWQYVTLQDGKVRDAHASLHGLILRHDDPAWGKIYPPNDWNCRCRVRPLLDNEVNDNDTRLGKIKASNYLKSDAYKKAGKHGWNVNRAELKEVFTADQNYIKGFPNNESKFLNRLRPIDYNLLDYFGRKALSTANMPVYEGTSAQWWETQVKAGKNAVLQDYSGKRVAIFDKNFKSHTNPNKAEYRERHKLLNALEDAIKNPDEIWVHDFKADKFGNLVYVKFYRDKVVVVITRIKEGKVIEIKTWYDVDEVKGDFSFRRGMCIKK